MSPSFVHEDDMTERARDFAREQIRQHGELMEVVCLTSPKNMIELTYKDGRKSRNDCSKGFFMQFGYMGTGPSCFWAFLDESGFSIPYDDIIRGPVILGHAPTRTSEQIVRPPSARNLLRAVSRILRGRPRPQ